MNSCEFCPTQKAVSTHTVIVSYTIRKLLNFIKPHLLIVGTVSRVTRALAETPYLNLEVVPLLFLRFQLLHQDYAV